MAFDGITVSALVAEIDDNLKGGRINKIAQPENDELLITGKGANGQIKTVHRQKRRAEMAKLINVGFGNVVNSRKIVAVVSPDAAPVKRMIQSVKGTRTLIDATQGRKTKAVIVTSDDYLVLSALQPETIARRFSEAYGEEEREEGNE